MGSTLERTKYPGVYRRGTRYPFVWRDAAGKQRWGTEATMLGAKKEKGRKEGTPYYSNTVLAHIYLLEWIDRYQGRTSKGFREESRREYRGSIEGHLIPLLGKRRKVVDINPRVVADLVAALAAKNIGTKQKPRYLSDTSIRRIMAPFKACMATAVEEGLIPTNPTRGVRLPVRVQILEDDDSKTKALSNAELVRLLECSPPEWYDLHLLLAVTGLRISEALPLRRQDFVLERVGKKPPHVKVRRRWRKGALGAPKSEDGRRDVPLSPTAVEVFAARFEAMGPMEPGDLVFPNAEGGMWNVESIYRRSIKAAAVAAGVPWVTFHTLRHTCATRLFAAGRNAKQVQRWLGHSTPEFTLKVYVHLMDGEVGDPIDVPTADGGDDSANGLQTSPGETEVGAEVLEPV